MAAASVAAVSFRVARHPGELHDPVHAERFERAREQLPLLGAVRVRSSRPDAAQRLVLAPTNAFATILRPERADAVFKRGRLLYAAPVDVERVLDLLKRKQLPEELPPAPDIGLYYRDLRGPYSCDVLLRDGESVESIRAILPDARLDGERVVREAEEDATDIVPRAILLALSAILLWRIRRGVAGLDFRLVATLIPLALLGVLGWGVDRWTMPALLLVAAAPRGLPLLAAVPCLFFPSLALQRIGLVLCVGGICRWTPAVRRRHEGWRSPLVLTAVLLAGAATVLFAIPLRARAPGPLRGEAAVTFVPIELAADRARSLRAEGFMHVVGGETPVPPPADIVTRRRLRRIHELATMLARQASGELAESYREVADAAALDELYLPTELRMRLRTRDRRAAIWVQDHVPVDRAGFESARLYRARGEIQLRGEARIAALIAFLLIALWLIRQYGEGALIPIAGRFAAAGVGYAILLTGESHGVVADVYLPMLVIAAMVPSLGLAIGVAAAAIADSSYLWPAAAFAAASALGWISEISHRRSLRSLLPSPVRPPSA